MVPSSARVRRLLSAVGIACAGAAAASTIAIATRAHTETDAERMDRVIGRETIALMVHGAPRFAVVRMHRSGSGTYYCGRVNGRRFVSLPRLAGFIDYGDSGFRSLWGSQCGANSFVRDMKF